MSNNKLYDFIKSMFSTKYEENNDASKKSFLFMSQRIMSIRFPIEANAYNHYKINGCSVSNLWNKVLMRSYKKIPGWIYTKSKEIKAETCKIDNSDLVLYSTLSKTDIRDVKFLAEIDPAFLNGMIDKIKRSM